MMGGPLVMLALVMAAVVTAGASRGAVDDGICNVVTQYVVGEGKAAVGGSTLTYCASSAECRRTAEQVCCNGWRRDPDSKKLRCIKIEPSDSASVGAVATDVGTDGDSRVSNTPKEKGGVRRPRGSAPLSEPNPVLRPTQSEANPPDGRSAPNAGQSVQNAAANLAAKGDGKSASGVDPPADVETSHSLSQPAGRPSSGAVGSDSGPNTASRGRTPGAAPAAGAEKHTPSGGVDNTREPSQGGSAKASGQPEGPPPEVVHTDSKNSSHSDVESKAPERKDNNDDPGVSTAGPAAPASSSAASVSTRPGPQMPVPTPAQGAQTTSSNLSPAGSRTSHTATPASPVATTPRNGEAPPSPVGQSGDNHPSISKSQAPASPTGQSGDNHPDVSKSQAPASPTGQSGDNHPDVSKSQAPASPTGKSGDNHPDVSKSQAPASPTEQSGDNHPDVSKSQAPASPTGQSGDNHPDVSKSQAPASPTEQSADNRPDVSKTEAPASATGQSGDNHPSVDNTRVNAPVNTDPNNNATGQDVEDSGPLTLTGPDLEHGRHVDTITPTDSSPSTAPNAIPTTTDKITTANVPRSEQTSTSAPGAAAIHPAQKEISHNSVHTEPSAGPATTGTTTTTASPQSIPHGDVTPASVLKPTDAPPAHHPNPQTNNNNLEYITVENNGSGANAPAGKSSVAAGQQGAANGTNAANVNGTNAANANGTNAANVNGTSATNCTVAGHERNCTDNSSAIPTVGLQTAPEAKPRAVPSGGSASKTASEVTISLLLVAAVAFVAALLYWRTRRRRRRYINCGTREPNLHFSNPVYDLESMMEQASLVKLQNAADVEDGGSSEPDHEGPSQRQ